MKARKIICLIGSEPREYWLLENGRVLQKGTTFSDGFIHASLDKLAQEKEVITISFTETWEELECSQPVLDLVIRIIKGETELKLDHFGNDSYEQDVINEILDYLGSCELNLSDDRGLNDELVLDHFLNYKPEQGRKNRAIKYLTGWLHGDIDRFDYVNKAIKEVKTDVPYILKVAHNMFWWEIFEELVYTLFKEVYPEVKSFETIREDLLGS